MKITDIAPYKGSTLAVTFDETETRYLHRDIVADFHLAVGQQVPEAALTELQQAADTRRAYERALYLLDVRAYGYVELFRKLSANYEEEVCYAVLQKLTSLGMINDRAYAEFLARKYVEGKRLGYRRAAMELQRRGLSQDCIQEALAPYADSTEERLLALLSHKYAAKLSDPADRNSIDKVKASLARLGYGYAEIRDALDVYFADPDA